jgi:hypothetical protein
MNIPAIYKSRVAVNVSISAYLRTREQETLIILVSYCIQQSKLQPHRKVKAKIVEYKGSR